MTRIHRLQHVQALFATHLAKHNPVGPHTQGVDHQLALADRSATLKIGRPCFQPDHVLLLELEFR